MFWQNLVQRISEPALRSSMAISFYHQQNFYRYVGIVFALLIIIYIIFVFLWYQKVPFQSSNFVCYFRGVKILFPYKYSPLQISIQLHCYWTQKLHYIHKHILINQCISKVICYNLSSLFLRGVLTEIVCLDR